MVHLTLLDYGSSARWLLAGEAPILTGDIGKKLEEIKERGKSQKLLQFRLK